MATRKKTAAKKRKPAAASRKTASRKPAVAASARRKPVARVQARPGLFSSMSLLTMLANIFGMHRS